MNREEIDALAFVTALIVLWGELPRDHGAFARALEAEMKAVLAEIRREWLARVRDGSFGWPTAAS